MPCRWEGNRRSGVALATSHRLQRYMCSPTGLRTKKGDEHPAYTLLMGHGTPLPFQCTDPKRCAHPANIFGVIYRTRRQTERGSRLPTRQPSLMMMRDD